VSKYTFCRIWLRRQCGWDFNMISYCCLFVPSGCGCWWSVFIFSGVFRNFCNNSSERSLWANPEPINLKIYITGSNVLTRDLQTRSGQNCSPGDPELAILPSSLVDISQRLYWIPDSYISSFYCTVKTIFASPLVVCSLWLKPCPHCRRKVRLSPKTARQRRNPATVALFCDSLTLLRQIIALFCDMWTGFKLAIIFSYCGLFLQLWTAVYWAK